MFGEPRSLHLQEVVLSFPTSFRLDLPPTYVSVGLKTMPVEKRQKGQARKLAGDVTFETL